MLPVNLDVSRINVALVGRGLRAVRRLDLLEEAGCRSIAVFSDAASAYLQVRAGNRLRSRLPSVRDLAAARLIYIVDLDSAQSEMLASIAQAAGCLVNVEDRRHHCDFHSPAVVRRGDLVIGISTNGRCPGLARRIRLLLERLFPADWAGRTAKLAERREEVRRLGGGPDAILRAVDAELAHIEPASIGHNGPPSTQPQQGEASAPASWAY